jgi:hypothetical protein
MRPRPRHCHGSTLARGLVGVDTGYGQADGCWVRVTIIGLVQVHAAALTWPWLYAASLLFC